LSLAVAIPVANATVLYTNDFTTVGANPAADGWTFDQTTLSTYGTYTAFPVGGDVGLKALGGWTHSLTTNSSNNSIITLAITLESEAAPIGGNGGFGLSSFSAPSAFQLTVDGPRLMWSYPGGGSTNGTLTITGPTAGGSVATTGIVPSNINDYWWRANIVLEVNTTTGLAQAYYDNGTLNQVITDFDMKGSLTSSQFNALFENGGMQYFGGRFEQAGSPGNIWIDNINISSVAVPEPTYASWATNNAGGQTADLDYDNDGVTNGVEYFMNAAPGFTANPALFGGTVTWPNGGNIDSAAYGSQFEVQTSTDLANWSAVASDDITLSNTAGALTWKVASIANGDMGSFTGNLPSSWVVSGGALTSASSTDNSPFTNKFATNSKSWIIDDSSDTSGSAGFLQAFSNKTNYPSVEVNFDFKLTALTGGTWGIQFDGAGASAIAASSVHYRIDAAGQFAINAGPAGGVITNILALEAGKWYNVRATFTTTALNTGSNEGAGVQSGTITPEGGSPVSWSNVPLLNTSLGFSRLLVRDRNATFAGDLLLDNVSVAPQGKQFVRLKVTPN
jgi:hypothetical protein